MSRVSCIEHPARDPFVLLRRGYMVLTDGDACAAMLLSVFEHWTNTRLSSEEERGGDLWIFRTIDELRDDDLCGAYGRDRVSKSLNDLIDTGLVERRRNPDKGWDRTWQYRLDIGMLQEAVDHLESGLNKQTRISEFASSDSSVSVGASDDVAALENRMAGEGRISEFGSATQTRKPVDASSDIRACKVGNPTSNTEDSLEDLLPPVSPPEGGIAPVPTGPDSGIRRQRERDRLAADQRAWARRHLPDEDPDRVVSVIGWATKRHGSATVETILAELRRAGLDAASARGAA